jgi:dUTP pyrophosphatase
MKIDIVRLPHAADLPLPAFATAGSAGMDLLAAVGADVVVAPGARALIPTGIAIAVPQGFEAQVRPRSGLAIKHGITLLNAPGTIDSDYRGEVGAIVVNHGDTPFTVSRGMKIAQLVIARCERIDWNETDALARSERGSGGFGSTGTHRDQAKV